MNFLITLTLFLLAGANAVAEPNSGNAVLEDSSFNKAYVPIGFDSNDRAEFVVEGQFPNACYRKGPISVVVDHKGKMIKLKSKSYLHPSVCIQVIVDYSQTVDVGILEAGDYTIVQGGEDKVIGTLPVNESSLESIDDFLYAPVNQALLTRINKELQLTLTGTFTNSCMRLSDVQVALNKDVFVVQPIAEMDETKDCLEGNYPFRYSELIDLDLKRGRYLLHVRSLNGKSVNNLVDLQ